MSFLVILLLAAVVFATSLISQGNNGAAELSLFIFVPSAIALYFAPSIVAARREHPNAQSITILNLLLGWTGLGWIGALIWAYSAG